MKDCIMTDVKTLKVHGNSFGLEYIKKPGVEYSCDQDTARNLIRDGTVVAIVKAAPPASRGH
jgi:hypothetical protein